MGCFVRHIPTAFRYRIDQPPGGTNAVNHSISGTTLTVTSGSSGGPSHKILVPTISASTAPGAEGILEIAVTP